MPNKTEILLKKIAQHFGISSSEFDWKSRLSKHKATPKHLSRAQSISRWIHRDSIPEHVINEILEMKITEELKGDFLHYLKTKTDRTETVPRQSVSHGCNNLTQIAEPNAHYGDLEKQEMDLICKAAQVLSSKTIYRTALSSNINAFYQAIQVEETAVETSERLKLLEEKMEVLSKQCEATASFKKFTV